jgi:broad specificity phosphatase PhoE
MTTTTQTRRLLLVRHGLPDYRFGQPGDLLPGPPLADVGRIQATQAAAVVAPFQPATIHASPLARTATTAEILRQRLGCPRRIDTDLREWHRTERLHDVSTRLTRWLVAWLRGPERCAVAVSHASPILALLRAALYLPNVNWHRPGDFYTIELSSADRFDVSMASVFDLLITPTHVTATCLFHPTPRIHHRRPRGYLERPPRPVPGLGENTTLTRPNFLPLLGA